MVVHACVNVIGDEEVHVAVAIDVGPGAARTEDRCAGDTRRAGDVGEVTAAVVAIQRVRADAGHVDVDPAVVVVVGGARAHAVAGMAEACSGGHVVERPGAAVPEQAMPGASGHRGVRDRPAVHQQQVLPAVVVVVEEQSAAAHDFVEMPRRARAADMGEVETLGRRDVLELWDGGRPGRRASLGRHRQHASADDQGEDDEPARRAHRAAPARRSASWRAWA